MVRTWTVLTILLVASAGWQASAQRADRVQRLDRMDRVQDQIAARERLADRVIADRVRDRVITDADRVRTVTDVADVADRDRAPEEVRPITDAEIEPAIVDSVATEGADQADAAVILLDPFGDRIRRGEVLALNPSAKALSELSRRNLRSVRQRELSDDAVLHVFRSARAINLVELLDALRSMDPAGLYTPNHVFAAKGAPASQESTPRDEFAPAGAAELSAMSCNIGLIDGPLSALPEKFGPAIVRSQRFETGPQSDSWHGAAVAYRLIDVADRVRPSQSVRVCAADVFSDGAGEAITADALVAAMSWQMAEGVSLVNASLAGPHNEIVAWNVERFVRSGGTLVAAVGNGGPLGRQIYPAAYEGVIGVTAIDASDEIYPQATRGSHVDIAARGVDLDYAPIGLAAPVSGTSFAAPVVSAWAMSHDGVINVAAFGLEDLGTPGPDPRFGHGVLRVPETPRLQLVAEQSDLVR